MAKKLCGRRIARNIVSAVLCLSVLVSASVFEMPAIALTHSDNTEFTAAAESYSQLTVSVGNSNGEAGQSSYDAYVIPCVITKENGSAENGALIVPASKESYLASTGAGEYAARLTDRSNDIGVVSEGYSDSPYTVSREVLAGTFVNVIATEENVGGTLFLKSGLKNYDDDQYWDGKKPFRVTAASGAEGQELMFTTYNDTLLEDTVAPYGALKYDHLSLTVISGLSQNNFFARGNKFVIGEGVTTQNTKTWRIHGGTEHNSLFETTGRPENLDTNIVVASADWDYIYGGGEGPTGRGTNVTIRGTASVDNVYGGGLRYGSIGLKDYAERNQGTVGNGINVFVEDGTVGNLWGGCQINSYSINPLYGKRPLPIYENININISGGHVARLIAGSDTSDGSTNEYSNMGDSNINGDAIVNINAENSVGSAAGDPNRNIPRSATILRQVQGITRMNITESNDFTYFDLFDIVNITGKGTANSVTVTSDEKVGESFADSSLTFWGTTSAKRDGFIGQIRVANGAKLVLDYGGTINKGFSHYVGGTWTQNSIEGNRALKGSLNGATHYLSKSWVGETSESRRSLSTVAINGQGSGITAASGDRFVDGTDTCGLRIHGNVQGELAHDSTYSTNVPGYSTLEVTGTPKYSDADNYFYYIVADSSANGGKAFKEPEGADYIVCYRYLEGGKIGWYLRQKPSVTLTNKLVRAGDSSNGSMVMSVNLNGFGYEWSENQSQNSIDFSITKVTGTNSASLTTVTDSISLAAISDIKNNPSGRFSNVVTDTDDSSGIEYLVSFDYLYDNSTPVDPTYYTVEANYHVVRDSGSYDDISSAASEDAARCIYDFAGNDELHPSGGYSDSIMTTFPYSTSPAGRDEALLRVYLPYGVTGSLAVAENDNHFRFTTDTSIDAELESCTTVTSNYASAAEAYANSHFGVTIGGSELSGGVSKTLSTAVSEYVCTVYSYKNLSVNDISQLSANGLQLNLTVSGLEKDGASVGTGSPSAVNNGELRIQTAGTYKITFRFNTRTQGTQVFVVNGNLGDALVDSDGQLTDEFVLSKAPYESNYGETLSWNAADIIRSNSNGVISAELTADQDDKLVSLNYRLTPTGTYSSPVMVPIGANRLNNANVAALTISDSSFKYWEIRKSGNSTAPVYARCYDAEFSYCIMDDYWISPVFEAATGSKSARLNPDALKNCDEDWLAWTYNAGDTHGVGTLIFPSEDLTFTNLKDKVNFVRVPKGTMTLDAEWTNVWNQTEDLDVQDGKTFTLTSWGDGKKMNGEWTDSITLTQTEYNRNRWTDSDGNLSANGRSDYLYSDFEIAFRDGAPKEIYSSSGYRTGAVFELCGTLGDGDTFSPNTYKYRSDQTNFKAAIVAKATSYSTDGATRRIQCNDISTGNLTKMNRIEFAKSYFNTPTNSKAIMKVTAYLVDSENNVTLSNPVYICLYDTSLRNLAISAG